MPESRPPLDWNAKSIAELEKLIDGRILPPIENWNPQHCGHSGICIKRDGSWLHDGKPITRPAMVRLFASVLRREPDGRHVLVTPFEMLEVDVEWTAFRAVELRSEGEGKERRIAFRLDNGDAVVLDCAHPLRIISTGGGPSPRLLVRHRLEAELTRSVYYELVQLALEDAADEPGVWSSGSFFPMSERE